MTTIKEEDLEQLILNALKGCIQVSRRYDDEFRGNKGLIIQERGR
jgi:hypothetical protein